MKVLKSWLQDHIVETLPSDEKIMEAFVFKSSEVEGVEKVKVDGKDDTAFDLKVLPDRAHYMLSHRGVAYDLCAILGLNLKEQDITLPKIGEDIVVSINSDICRRNTATLITNIKNTKSPQWLKDRLEAICGRSINAIVDATNYSTFDTGQPLHAFDYDKVKGKLSVRFAKESESIETLDGKIIKLKSHHLVIADEEGPLDIAGIKGGKRAEVTLDTKNIILESANFDPVSIRKTSIEVGIRNDASKRFENEITPYLVPKGVSKFLNILKEISPNAVVGLMNDKFKDIPKPWIVNLNHTHIESVLNCKISEKEVVKILTTLQCKVESNNGEYIITPPFERLDLIIPEDIIDEIGRINGLDKVKSIVPKLKTNNEFSQEYLLNEKIKDFLFEKGYSEILTRSFTNKGEVEVAYPMATDKSFLRTNINDNVINSISLAVKNAPLLGLDEVKIFEIGKIFTKDGEKNTLVIGIKNIKKKQEKEKEKIKNIRDELLKELEIDAQILCTVDDTGGIISMGGKTVGYTNRLDGITEIDLDILSQGIKKKLNLDSIKVQKGSRTQFRPFSQYPFITRDIALFVDSGISATEVGEEIRKDLIGSSNELLVKGPDLFDEFEKDGNKSLAFRMIFQSSDRTLSDEEVNGYMDRLYTLVKGKGWQVR